MAVCVEECDEECGMRMKFARDEVHSNWVDRFSYSQGTPHNYSHLSKAHAIS